MKVLRGPTIAGPAMLVSLLLTMTSRSFAQSQTPVAATNDLLLREFKPVSKLHLTEHRVERARFPVIDIHNHLNDAGMMLRPHPTAKEIVAWMDRRNIQKITILTGGWPN